MALIKLPNIFKGKTDLDRSAFEVVIHLLALRIQAKNCGRLLKELAKRLLNYPKLKNVVADPAEPKSSNRLILLQEHIKSIEELSSAERKCIDDCHGAAVSFSLKVGYDFWSAEQVLASILPENISVPTSFETVGHIAHVNLRQEHEPFKKVIGQVLLDKNSPQIRTVVNKLHVIEHTFRHFDLEVLAGESLFETEVHEGGCKFSLDYSKVYWNSRLQHEHERLVRLFKPNDIICDMFAGIGPFSIPAARKGCIVYANDLNPTSFHYLTQNAKLNNVEKNIKAYNQDARIFMQQVIKNELHSHLKRIDHVLMNLPSTAIEFLDSFQGVYDADREDILVEKMPMIHCHYFQKSSKHDDLNSDSKEFQREEILARIEQVLKYRLSESEYEIHHVRNVAPNKNMYCISFKLPRSIAFYNAKYLLHDANDHTVKKFKVSQ